VVLLRPAGFRLRLCFPGSLLLAVVTNYIEGDARAAICVRVFGAGEKRGEQKKKKPAGISGGLSPQPIDLGLLGKQISLR
jgi:hypothetical protein